MPGQHAGFGDILAVCDVDAQHAERAKQDGKIGKGKADSYGDYRKVLDRNDIDVVSVVTPDHWHVKIAIEALEAGKHVFCQKPLTLTLEENQLIRNACKKHKDQVFFIGTQQRSTRDKFLRAVNMVQKGLAGRHQDDHRGHQRRPQGRAVPRRTGAGISRLGNVARPGPQSGLPPETLPLRIPLVVRILRRQIHRLGRPSRGHRLLGDRSTHEGQGPVEIDGTDANHPVEFKDGYPLVDDCYNTSHDFSVKCRYENGIVMDVTSRGDNGITFDGTKGRIFVNRGKITGKPIEENWDRDQFTDEDVVRLYKGKPFEGHKNNFYRCIAEGGLPVSDVYSHVQTMATCHLSAIAARLGRVIKWDPKTEQIVGDEQAASFFSRERRDGYEIVKV